MIYLTNDELDQAVYFEVRGESRRNGEAIEQLSGFLGNGIFETPVTLRSGSGGIEIIFGESELFDFVGEDTVRSLLKGELAARETVH